MASFFGVGAAVSLAAHGDGWRRLASGDASLIDWFYAITAAIGVLTGVLFATGRATGLIARGWICYCTFEAIGACPFWAVPPANVADNVTGFLGNLAVSASLMLYLSVAENNG
jgi:hypothetical protein